MVARYFILFISLSSALCQSVDNEEIHRQDLIDLVNEVKNNIDSTVDPCTDFQKYACGNIAPQNFTKFLQKLIYKNEPRNDDEKILFDIYKSCEKINEYPGSYADVENAFEQIDFLKRFEHLPVKQGQYTTKDITELEAFINSVGLSTIVHTKFYNRVIMESLYKSEMYDSEHIFNYFQSSSLSSLQQEQSIPLAKFAYFMDDMKKLIEKKENRTFKGSTDEIKLKSIVEIKNLLPSNKFDWDEFYQILANITNSFKHNNETEFYIKEKTLLKDIFNLLDSTDVETIINYQIFMFIRTLTTTAKCRVNNAMLVRNMMLTMYERIFTNRTIKRMKDTKNILDAELTAMSKYTKSDLELENFEFWKEKFPKTDFDDYVDDFYSNVRANETYKAVFSLLQKSFGKSVEAEIANYNEPWLIQAGFTHYFMFRNLKNKPYLYLYNVWNRFWWYIVLRNSFKTDFAESCLTQIKEDTNNIGNDKLFITSYFIKKILMNFEDTEGIIDKELNWAKDLIKPEHLVFLLQAQYVCQESRDKFNDEIIRPFRHLEEFSKAFSCSKNSKMHQYENNVCDLGNCPDLDPVVRKLLPFTFKGCSS